MPGAGLLVERLIKTYGDTVALAGIDLSVEAGSYVVILGPSGSGKTTLLSILGGFTHPTSGRVLVEGRAGWGVPSGGPGSPTSWPW
jgi:spermidine/putrescine transport system ATP-binding protein